MSATGDQITRETGLARLVTWRALPSPSDFTQICGLPLALDR